MSSVGRETTSVEWETTRTTDDEGNEGKKQEKRRKEKNKENKRKPKTRKEIFPTYVVMKAPLFFLVKVFLFTLDAPLGALGRI